MSHCWFSNFLLITCLTRNPPTVSPLTRVDFYPPITCIKMSASLNSVVLVSSLADIYCSALDSSVDTLRSSCSFYFCLRCYFFSVLSFNTNSDKRLLTEEDLVSSTATSFWIELFFVFWIWLSADTCFFWPPLLEWEKSSELLKPPRYLLLLPRLPLLPLPRPFPDEFVASLVLPPE